VWRMDWGRCQRDLLARRGLSCFVRALGQQNRPRKSAPAMCERPASSSGIAQTRPNALRVDEGQ